MSEPPTFVRADLRSDTLTKPTAAMRAAIAQAEVGDEQYGEDPTVLLLERRTAGLLGQDEAVFVPSATMANQIALMLSVRAGDAVLAARDSHILRYEVGGPAVHARAMTGEIAAERGIFTVDALERAIVGRGSSHEAETAVLTIENTHNASGGTVWPVAPYREVVEFARARGLHVHLDGARLWHAAIAHAVPLAAYGGPADSVTVCLSKGLGCPAGALLAVSAEQAPRARRYKQLMGGGLRQSGVLAAAGLHALDHHLERLADDHARARAIERSLGARACDAVPWRGETNFVLLEPARVGMQAGELRSALARRGVLVSETAVAGRLRAVTHLGIDDEAAAYAAEAIPAALAGGAR